MVKYWLYRLATVLAPLLPEWFGYWFFARLGDLAYLFGTGARRAYSRNLSHVLGPDTEPARARHITRLAFQNLLKNYYDLFRGHRLSPAEVQKQLAEVKGIENLDAALALGKGMVAGSAHLGNFNLFIHLAALHLKAHGRIVVPTERLRPEPLYRLIVKQRAAQGMEIVPVDTALRAIVKTLRGGGIAGLALDLDVTHTGPVVDFFGAPAQLPDGAVALALKYEVPLVIGFTRRLSDNRCAVVIEPALELERTGDLARDTRAGVEKLARRLEDWICRFPEQWMIFQPLWQQDL